MGLKLLFVPKLLFSAGDGVIFLDQILRLSPIPRQVM
jgi:hypothetical protein